MIFVNSSTNIKSMDPINKRHNRRLLKTAILLLFAAAVFWGSKGLWADFFPTTKTVLDNGLTVIITEMPESPSTAVYVLVQAGGATEGKYLGSGLSHFIEHMVFKGTPTRGVGVITSQIQAAGGRINASTDNDHTLFTITVPTAAFDLALDVMADMVGRPVMEAQELEKERDVILSEMRLHDDNPSRIMSKITYQNIYREHPYRHPVIGYPELFKKLSRQDLLDHHRKEYVPNNMILSVAGNVSREDALAKIKKIFGDFPRGNPVTRDLVQEPPQSSPRFYEKYYPTDLAQLSMAFSGIRFSDPDMVALDVLSRILGQNGRSSLYNPLYRDLKLVYGISSEDFTPIDRGVFEVNAELENKNVDAAMAAIWKVLNKVKSNGVGEEELAAAKKSLAREQIFELQTASSVASMRAYDESVAHDEKFSEKYVETIQKITRDDIRNVARKYLIPNTLTVTVLRPLKDQPAVSSSTNEIKKSKPHLTTLSNGARVVVKEDAGLPIVNIRIVWNGGTREEPQDLTGVSQLMASLLSRGTMKHTAKQLSEIADEKGISFGAFSGQNSVGLSVDCLAQDLPEAWSLIDEILHQPVFDAKEMDAVKNDMRAAIRQRSDRISETTLLEMKEVLFQGHPLRFDNNGSLETVDRLNREAVVTLFRKLAVPDHMVVSVYGDVKSDAVLKNVSMIFGHESRHGFDVSKFTPSPLNIPCDKTVRMNKEQAMVMLGFRGLTMFDTDRYALEVLTEILTSPFDGRLFRAVREKEGKAYTVGGDFIPSLDAGFVYLFALTAPDHANEVSSMVREEIEKLKTTSVSDEELKNLKTFMKGQHALSLETNAQKAFMAALDELYGFGYGYEENFDPNIDRVTAADISRVAAKILDTAQSCQVVTVPSEEKP